MWLCISANLILGILGASKGMYTTHIYVYIERILPADGGSYQVPWFPRGWGQAGSCLMDFEMA